MNEQQRRGLFTKLTGKLASVEGGMYRGFCAGIGNVPVFEAFETGKKQEREACKEACVDLSHHFPAGSRERDALQRMATRLDMRSNANVTGPAPGKEY